MPELRVAIVCGNFDVVVDGVSLTLHRQADYLRAHGATVRVYAPTGPRRIAHTHAVVAVPSIGVFDTPYRLAAGLSAVARRDLAAFRPSLVHVATPDWLGWSAVRWANTRRVPVAATYFTHFGRYAKHYRLGFLEPLAWRYQRAFYRRCTEVLVPCTSVADDLAAQGVRGPFAVSPFGVDLEAFSPARRSAEWRQRHGFAADDVVIVFVGRLVWEKGLDLWAKVIGRLEAAGVPHRSAIVGEGPAGAAMRARLPRTVFTGRLAQPELGTAVASCDLFFFPSDSETFGCVTAEALAAGVPAVVADATGSRDLVRPNENGLVCRAGDEAGFYAAVLELLRDAPTRRWLAAHGPASAAPFAWDRVLADHLTHVRRLTGGG